MTFVAIGVLRVNKKQDNNKNYFLKNFVHVAAIHSNSFLAVSTKYINELSQDM